MSEQEDLVAALRVAWDEAGVHVLDDRGDSMWCIECDREYDLSECEVADGFECPNASFVSKEGYCYQIAGSALLRSRVSGAVLVHATVNGNIDHAWLEHDGNAFDFSRREIVQPAATYRANVAAKEVRAFSLQDVARLLSEVKHWGPWESEPHL